jgi:L-alanine-DL-glutamate epimerase-like enolase superfamily enzyme
VSDALELVTEVRTIAFRDPFRIARDPNDATATTVLVELQDPESGLVGLGEGCPDAYYGETPATMAAVFALLLGAVGRPDWTVEGLAAAGERMDAALGNNGAAKCALDIALHDLAARRAGLPLHAFLGLAPEIPPTDFSLGIDTPEVVAERASRAARFPALKIKLGGPSDLATLEAVRAVYGGAIRVDANTAWTLEEALAILPELERLGVELVEQPFPARRYDLLRALQERSPLPIVADESVVTIADLDPLVGVVVGINVKLAKCGGVGPAKRMLERARMLGFRTFLGCMEETSAGIAASAAVASLADWVDLDGCLLLSDDPFDGLELDDGCRWRLGPRPGLGISRRIASGAAVAG